MLEENRPMLGVGTPHRGKEAKMHRFIVGLVVVVSL
jgi:hypothetical protein